MVNGQLHAPAALLPWKIPSAHWVGGCLEAPELAWTFGEDKGILPVPGFEPRTVLPVA